MLFRVSYLEFLRPFAMKFAPYGHNMFNKILAQNKDLPPIVTDQINPNKDLESVTEKLKNQVND